MRFAKGTGVLRAQHRCTAALAAALCFSAAQAHAANLTLEAKGSETGSWSSNPMMALGSVKPLWGSTTSPEFLLRDTNPDLQFVLGSRIDENIFNQSAFNSTDVHANAGVNKQTERWTFGFQQHTDYDTTRTSELSNFGLPSTVVTRHTGLSYAPEVSYSPTALDTINLTGSAATSRYGNSAFIDYDLYTVTPSYTHRLNPLNSAILTLQAQRYMSLHGADTRVDSIGPTIGWSGTLTPRLSAHAAVGGQTSRQYNSGVAVAGWQANYIFSTGVDYKGVQDTIGFTAERSQSPYGNGSDALETNLSFTESHALNSLVSLNFGAGYLTSDYQASPVNSVKSQSNGSAGLTYHATDQIDLTAMYQYRYETLTGTSQTVDDHSVTVGVSIHPTVWTLLK